MFGDPSLFRTQQPIRIYIETGLMRLNPGMRMIHLVKGHVEEKQLTNFPRILIYEGDGWVIIFQQMGDFDGHMENSNFNEPTFLSIPKNSITCIKSGPE